MRLMVKLVAWWLDECSQPFSLAAGLKLSDKGCVAQQIGVGGT